MNKIHCKNLGACEICDHCFEQRHPWYYCSINNDNFGNISYPNECDEFVELCDDDDDDEDFNPTEVIVCPCCDSDAYWNGSEYECSNDRCGWCGLPD